MCDDGLALKGNNSHIQHEVRHYVECWQYVIKQSFKSSNCTTSIFSYFTSPTAPYSFALQPDLAMKQKCLSLTRTMTHTPSHTHT